MSDISIRLPDDISARLQSLARLTGRSKTSHIIEALAEHIDGLEGLYLAEHELNAVRTGESKTTSLNDVISRHDLRYR